MIQVIHSQSDKPMVKVIINGKERSSTIGKIPNEKIAIINITEPNYDVEPSDYYFLRISFDEIDRLHEYIHTKSK